jgi:NTE family protein
MLSLAERLAAFPLLEALDAKTLASMAENGAWFSLAGGAELFRQDARSRTLFLLLSGRLIVVRRLGDADEVVGYVRAGEPVGEMSLLSGEPHSASVYALRDTEILALGRSEVLELIERDPDLALALSRSILERSRHPHASYLRSAPKVFAFIGTSPAVDVEARAREIARRVGGLGKPARALSEADAEECLVAFENIEAAHDVVILAARVGDTSWYKFALRHADRFLVLARRDARPPAPFPLTVDEDSPARKFRLVDLVAVEEGAPSSMVREWSDAVAASRIFHWSGEESVARLARVIAGRSVALVLSGGGARAYAHIGAIRALREARAPIDFIAGTSMGAIVGACAAMGWPDAEIEARIRDAFVASNPLGDHVLPVVALTAGRLVEQRLEKHFGDTLIEDMPTPFFCVSSELVGGRPVVHREGLLRKALRASVSLPGILPPVVVGERLYVDGAVMDNFPTAVVGGLHRGVTIGVDVAREGSISAADYADPPGFLAWVRRHGVKSPPPIVALLMRAATARAPETGPKSRPADLVVAPEVPGVGLRDWKKFDVAVADGYQAMKAAIAANAALFEGADQRA